MNTSIWKYLKYVSVVNITVFSGLALGSLIDGYKYFWDTYLKDGGSCYSETFM
jgi:hypothetical protein